ncbi:Candidapepsin-7 like [Actinidia chinensis var. chinensis]|uniref:Candidapepsin-7 like n=1 Tax=Actinidia chinensis var. chinensis TaxID=1590841 RepID=A0A2R6PDV9_ACTCC|nr:Candidapepsin-7 like [Actinidia chinensis var. chinensis]
MHSSPVLSFSPSFNNCSSGKLAEIAARVVEEFRHESESEFDDDYGFRHDEYLNDKAQKQPQVEEKDEANDSEEDENDEFEFPTVCREPNPAISADEIFYGGQIRPVFPIFGRNLSFSGVGNGNGRVDCCKPPIPPSSVRIPLGKLMNEDRDPPSCSSSEADDLEGVPAETYCVWKPKSAAAEKESPGSCKKSNSTGSSKRWKFRDLLHRSNSDGKDTFVFLAAKKDEKADASATATEKSSIGVKFAGKVKPKGIGGNEVVPVTEAHYARKGSAVKDGDRRRSFLPYRQDFVGLFANVNGVSRNLHPF